jgi:hypothetical protein
MHRHSPNSGPQAKTAKLSTTADRIKSYVRNILLASPAFPRLYADVVISSAPNSNEAKILARNYQKIIERTAMPVHPNVQVCTHIKVTGVRCGSPALGGEQFCYFHQRMVRGVSTPPGARLHPIALIENEEAIQASLMEVINALIRNTIDLKRAELILRALHIAVRNARRVHFSLQQSEMVREVPTYPASPKPAPVREAPAQTIQAEITTSDAATAHVGTASQACPEPSRRGYLGGPAVSGRSALAADPAAPVDPTRRKLPTGVRESPSKYEKAKRSSSRT